MKHLQLFASFLMPLLLLSGALGQAADREPSDDQLANHPDIRAARNPYLRTADLAGERSGGASPQTRRPSPRPPFPPRAGHPRTSLPAMWSGGNPKHAAIGALIGFGLGAALGAKANSDNHRGAGVKAAFLVGSLGAPVGAVAGNSLGPFNHRSLYGRRWPAQDDFGSSSQAETSATDSIPRQPRSLTAPETQTERSPTDLKPPRFHRREQEP